MDYGVFCVVVDFVLGCSGGVCVLWVFDVVGW